MKKLIIAVMLVAFAFTVAYAADVVIYDSKQGSVTFNHKEHADKLGCEACHEGTPTKIAIDKNAAHQEACRDCHRKQGGPTKCGECHIKSSVPTDPVCRDTDYDGYSRDGGKCGKKDCNDSNRLIYPGAMEVCNDGQDNNCDGKIDCLDKTCATDAACTICTDRDSDGYAVELGGCGPVDCNDKDLAIHPGAVEHCSDAIDNDCDGLVDCSDADCNGNVACGEVCIPESSVEGPTKCFDGIDNDCDGSIDCADIDCINESFCQ